VRSEDGTVRRAVGLRGDRTYFHAAYVTRGSLAFSLTTAGDCSSALHVLAFLSADAFKP
jgi:hypothetical protein